MAYWYYKSNPLEVRDGYQTKNKRGRFGKKWYSSIFINNMEETSDSARMARARSYIRKGQIAKINIKIGELNAEVQGSRRGGYKVNLKFPKITKTDYKGLIRQLAASDDVHSLIKGALNENVSNIVQQYNMIPQSLKKLGYHCSCPDNGKPCKHVGSIIYALSELIDDDPMLLFVMNGINKDDLINSLSELSVGKHNGKTDEKIKKIERILKKDISSITLDSKHVIQHFYRSSPVILGKIKEKNNYLVSHLEKSLPITWIGDLKREINQFIVKLPVFMNICMNNFDVKSLNEYYPPSKGILKSHELDSKIQNLVYNLSRNFLFRGLDNKSIEILGKNGIRSLEDLANFDVSKFKGTLAFSKRELRKFKILAIKELSEDIKLNTKSEISVNPGVDLTELKGIGKLKSDKIKSIGISSILDLCRITDEQIENEYYSRSYMNNLRERAIKHLGIDLTGNLDDRGDNKSIIMHGFWVSMSEAQSPGLFLWFEDPAKSLNTNGTKDKLPPHQINNPDKLSRYPYSFNFKRYLNDKPDLNLLLHTIKEEETVIYLPTTSDKSPFISSVERIRKQAYWPKEEEYLRRLSTKIEQSYSERNIDLDNLNLFPWIISGIQLNSRQSIMLLQMISEDYLKEFALAEDIKFWLGIFDMLKNQILNTNIIPSVLPEKEFKQYFSNQSNISSNGDYVAWWKAIKPEGFYERYSSNQNTILFSANLLKQKYEKKVIMVSVDSLRPRVAKIDDKTITKKIKSSAIDIEIDYTPAKTVSDIVSDNSSINNFMHIITNNLLRSIGLEESLNKSNFNNKQLVSLIHGLFSNDLILSDENYWFYNELTKWYEEDNKDEWKLLLQLIPPDEEFDNEWILSFYLKNIIYPHIIIPVTEIIKNPRGPYHSGNFVIQKPMDILIDLLSKSSEISDIFNKIINQSSFLYYPLNQYELDQLLGKLGQKLLSNNIEVLLPKSVLRNYSPNKNNKLEISISSKGKLSMQEIVKFDYHLLIDGERIDANEIERMAEERKSLVQIAGKWVHFDFVKASKIKKILEEKKSDLHKLDLIKFEMGDHEILGDLGQDLNLEVRSNLRNLTRFNENKIAINRINGFNGKLREYQKRGVEWMVNLATYGMGGCMADDMGLGKTIQTLAALLYIKNNGIYTAPVLIVAPTSVIGNWISEVNTFTPSLNVYLHHGQDRVRDKSKIKDILKNYDIFITSYSLVRRDVDLLSDVIWSGIILDEAQNIKNPATQQSKIINKLNASFRFSLTGTPVENNLLDLWSIFNFNIPGYLGSQKSFKTEYIKPIEVQNDDIQLKKLRKLSFPFIIRRNKNDRSIIKDLPEKNEIKVQISLTKEQMAFYRATTKSFLEEIQSREGMERKGMILASITKLKQICNHLATFIDEEKYREEKSGKLENLIIRLSTIIESGEKAIIFTQYRSMGKILQDEITKLLGYEPFYLHGGTPRKQREHMISEFNGNILKHQVLIISLKAGGTGLNLIAATHVFHYDRWWNPAVEDQATDRAYRIGQNKTVFVYKFITKGTIEVKIDEIISDKRKLADQFISGLPKQLTELSNEELKEILTYQEN